MTGTDIRVGSYRQLLNQQTLFIERDSALSPEEINTRLNMLREVCETGDDSQAREVLRKAVPTFKKPEEVNRAAEFVVHQKKSEPEREEAVAI